MESQNSSFNETKKRIDYSPKGILVEFPFVLDACVKSLIDDFQSSFKQRRNGTFVLSKPFSKKSLEALLSDYMSKTIDRAVSGASRAHSDWQSVFVVVSDSGSERRAFFEMLEKDIDIGLSKIVSVAEALFKKNFAESSQIFDGRKTIWCKHSLLSAHDWEAVCEKKVFGKKNFVSCFADRRPIAIKELIDSSKIEKLSKQEQKIVVEEAAQWIRAQL